MALVGGVNTVLATSQVKHLALEVLIFAAAHQILLFACWVIFCPFVVFCTIILKFLPVTPLNL